MDLTSWLLRRTPVRPLIAAAPGGTAARLAAEREARVRGWRPALNPAEANLLIVAGQPQEPMAAAVEAVWRQMPFPRVRAELLHAAEVEGALDDAVRRLHSADHQRAQAHQAHPNDPAGHEHGEHPDAHGAETHTMDHGHGEPHEGHPRAAHGHGDHGPASSMTPHHGAHDDHAQHHEHASQGQAGHEQHHRDSPAHRAEQEHHAKHDQGGHEHDRPAGPDGHAGHGDHGEHPGHGEPIQHTAQGNHGGHADQGGHGGHDDHGGHGGHAGHDMSGMEMPGGIPMADRSPDRDGLQLDQLHVQLGPILPAWPEGLVVRTALQGDVIQEATIDLLPAPRGSDPFWSSLAEGVPGTAARRLDSCRRLLTVAGWEEAAVVAARLRDSALAGERIDPEFSRWARRVRRSRVLRWSLSGVGALDEPGSPLAGDAMDRLTRWLHDAEAELRDGVAANAEDPVGALERLPGLLAGSEFAAARLIVASLDPELERARVAHG
ncbi:MULTISPECIES: hypothetical protein [Amycolatopsis]|uniref:hypothetical protein n=1 Tax=Amycolatopsis TaxID=1813 RepID=UPI0033A9180C